MFASDLLQGGTVLVAAVAFLFVTLKGTSVDRNRRR